MTKQELREYYWIQRNIEKLEERLEELETKATQTTTQLKQDPIMGHGNVGDKVGNTVAEIEKVMAEIEVQLSRSYAVLNEIEKAIEKLPAREKYLIRARYIEMHSWEEIAVDMDYSWQHIHRIHSEALKMLA